MTTTTRRPLAVRNTVGLALAGLLGVVDITGPSPAGFAAQLHFPQPTGNEADPFSIDPFGPAVMGVFVTAGIVSLATIVGIVLTLVTRNRVYARVVAAARVISVLITLPFFVLQGQPAYLIVVASALVIGNITAVILVLSRPSAYVSATQR